MLDDVSVSIFPHKCRYLEVKQPRLATVRGKEDVSRLGMYDLVRQLTCVGHCRAIGRHDSNWHRRRLEALDLISQVLGLVLHVSMRLHQLLDVLEHTASGLAQERVYRILEGGVDRCRLDLIAGSMTL